MIYNSMIKKISDFDISGIITKQYPEYTLIVGKKSEDIFNYFAVDELHGLFRSECHDNPKNAYIAGLCNVYPDDHSKYFIFLNSIRLGNGYKDPLLIMHECMHMSLEVHGSDLTYRNGNDIEEIAITWAEENAESIYEFLMSKGIL
jgi:hypothetical protein